MTLGCWEEGIELGVGDDVGLPPFSRRESVLSNSEMASGNQSLVIPITERNWCCSTGESEKRAYRIEHENWSE